MFCLSLWIYKMIAASMLDKLQLQRNERGKWMNKWKKRTKLSSSGSAPGLIKSLKNKSWTIHLQPWIYSLALSIAQRWCILQIQSYPTRVTRVPHPRLQKIQSPNYKLYWITPTSCVEIIKIYPVKRGLGAVL